MGRPPLGHFAMSAAERQRRRRAGLAGKDSEPARPPTKVERLGRELARLTQQNEALRRRVNASQAVPFDLEDAPERVRLVARRREDGKP